MRHSLLVAVAVMVGAVLVAQRYVAHEAIVGDAAIALPTAAIAWPPINPNNFSLAPHIDAQEIRRFVAADVVQQIGGAARRMQDFQVLANNPAGFSGMVPQ
ncbi:MAG TPA: hypothetical protein VL976_06165 [Xanthobacteraceae bacterium]|nr:hypothetical protein [Xanthobacteraceae bacterium]